MPMPRCHISSRNACSLLHFHDPLTLYAILLKGVLVPGGFGERGVEGKIAAAHWARVNRKPFLGICLGLQCAVIEFARNELNMPVSVIKHLRYCLA